MLAQPVPGQDVAIPGLGLSLLGSHTLLQPADLRVVGTTKSPACRMQQSVDMGAVTAPCQGYHPSGSPSDP